MIEEITYYDWSTLLYTGAFLEGFRDNAREAGYRFRVASRLPAFMQEPEFTVASHFLKATGFPNSAALVLNCIGLFKLRGNGEEFHFCIDAGDHSGLSVTGDGLYFGYHLPLLQRVRFYFKVNHNQEVVSSNPQLRELSRKIVPVPIVYPRSMQGWNVLGRSLSNGAPTGSLIRRSREIVNLASIDDLRRYRGATKDLDTFFLVNHYDNPLHGDHNEFRLEIVERLRKSRDKKVVAGFASDVPLPGKFENYRMSRFDMKNYLRMQARSRVGIYVRGVHRCLSFKLGSYLEMGLPVVGEPLYNNRKFYYRSPLFGRQFAYDTPAEICQAFHHFLADPVLLNETSLANASFFDDHLTPKALTREILHRVSRPFPQASAPVDLRRSFGGAVMVPEFG